MGKIYTLDNKLLTETPEIRVGDKIYPVDSRMKTFKKMDDALKKAGESRKSQDSQESEDQDEFDIIITHALGANALKEIKERDIPFPAMRKLVVLIMAAMQDIEEEEAERRFRQQAGA